MTKAFKRIAVSAALIAVSVGLWLIDSKPHLDRLGAAESWSTSFPFSKNPQAEVLETGLDDVRGLACDANGNVFLAEANGRVLEYTAAGSFREPLPLVNKPGELPLKEPEKIDQRGAVVCGKSLFIAAHGQGRVVSRESPLDASREEALDVSPITGPSGIAVASDTLFITDDRPWPGPSEDTSFDSSDYTRWIDKGTSRLFGAVYTCTVQKSQWTVALVGSRLRHPSGIAAEGPNGPLFVAESDSAEVRWAIFEKNHKGGWTEAGALGSAPAAGGILPPFMGVAIDDAHQYVFAAGPKSLYVFSRQDGMLGRILFEEPVTGVAYHARAVYLMAGHQLCRLRMDEAAAPVAPVREPAGGAAGGK